MNRLLYSFSIFILILLFIGCGQSEPQNSSEEINFDQRIVTKQLQDSLINGETYLSVYSQIYGLTQTRIHDLTVIASMRNMNARDTVFIQKADLYDTHGALITSYVEEVIFIAPMETIEIIIEENDPSGGTGANFLFEWQKPESSQDPLFEGVMISTSGQQGLSFLTRGIRTR